MGVPQGGDLRARRRAGARPRVDGDGVICRPLARQPRESLAGIEFRDSEALVDEIPAAYEPIDQVMADSADLVEIRHTLRQVVNVKGD